MELLRLEEDLKYVNQIGRTLNIEERMGIMLALQKLNESLQLEVLQFWGKIEGIDNDYYIARGLSYKGAKLFPKKQFFWAYYQIQINKFKSSSDFKFSSLPQNTNEYKQSCLNLRKPFSGQQEQLLPIDPTEQHVPRSHPKINLKEDSDFLEYNLTPVQQFTELIRLSWTVDQIEHDCQLVPYGVIKTLPTNELCINEQYKGLDSQDALKLENYGHFRKQENQEKIKLVERGDSLFRSDFFDPIEEDLPHGQWSIQSDSSQTQISIRNLLWPGYVAYYRTKSNIFGGAYFGNGIKNIDLPFLL